MHHLELELLRWIAAANPSVSVAIEGQIQHARVANRDFTDGGGVFVSFDEYEIGTATSQRVPVQQPGQSPILEGPHIASPELEAGADALLFFNVAGVISTLEIQALANDYPIGRHPSVFELRVQDGTYIDYRPE